MLFSLFSLLLICFVLVWYDTDTDSDPDNNTDADFDIGTDPSGIHPSRASVCCVRRYICMNKDYINAHTAEYSCFTGCMSCTSHCIFLKAAYTNWWYTHMSNTGKIRRNFLESFLSFLLLLLTHHAFLSFLPSLDLFRFSLV